MSEENKISQIENSKNILALECNINKKIIVEAPENANVMNYNQFSLSDFTSEFLEV